MAQVKGVSWMAYVCALLVWHRAVAFLSCQALTQSGAPAIMCATMLPDRVMCLTQDSDRNVQRWNVVRGVLVESLGQVDYKAQVGLMVFTPSLKFGITCASTSHSLPTFFSPARLRRKARGAACPRGAH
jgi:hypothetical protein